MSRIPGAWTVWSHSIVMADLRLPGVTRRPVVAGEIFVLKRRAVGSRTGQDVMSIGCVTDPIHLTQTFGRRGRLVYPIVSAMQRFDI